MYMPEPDSNRSSLQTNTGTHIPLQAVKVETNFSHLFCRTIMTQVYRNLENKPIEAVYTFPLSSQAVILRLEVSIGKRKLQGLIVEKASAEEHYEEAIGQGTTAIMLEQPQAGLYTMNVGNLLAGEEISIAITYAELCTWQGDTIRFLLPTTIAPRYGNPESAGLEPHQTPKYSIVSENRLELKIIITGALTEAEFTSPSHAISVNKTNSETVIGLAPGSTCMDRDFILNICQPHNNKDNISIEPTPQGGYVALASFAPKIPLPEQVPAKNIKIVVDCSGSMNGDSITQARQAISEIFKQLRPEDFFNLITFGSTCNTLFKQQVPASKANLTIARRWLRSLEADMGGTEIQIALETAVKILGPVIPADILLITDGEIWDSGETIKFARQSEHRFFTVGVGNSVAQDFVRQLAEKTGGACELVAPREQMAARIVRHFERIYLPQAQEVVIKWPVPPKKIIPQNNIAVFAGDTLHSFAFFDILPKGPVTLYMALANGQTFSQSAIINDQLNQPPDNNRPGPITRMAIARSLPERDEIEAASLAVEYQLISRFTNFLVIDEQSEKEKSGELPLLRKVPQTLAAGWGGSGTVVWESAPDYDIPSFCKRALLAEPEAEIRFCRRQTPEQAHKLRQQTTPAEFIQKCNRLHPKHFYQNLEIKKFEDLSGCDLPDRILAIIEEVSSISESHLPEELIILAFLLGLSQSSVSHIFSQKSLKAIKKAQKNLSETNLPAELFNDVLTGISDDDWGPGFAEKVLRL